MPWKPKTYLTSALVGLPALALTFTFIQPSGSFDDPTLGGMGTGMQSLSPYEQDTESLGVDDGETSPNEPEYSEPEPADRDPPGVSSGRTDRIVTEIERTTDTCDYYVDFERIDCLRDGLQKIVRTMPQGGDYADMRKALSEAVVELDTVVRQNADPAAKPVRRQVKTPRGTRTSATRIRPIAPQRLEQANAQATAVLDRLSTKLLRSASNSASKRVHYERAAQAIDSAKVLLRSA